MVKTKYVVTHDRAIVDARHGSVLYDDYAEIGLTEQQAHRLAELHSQYDDFMTFEHAWCIIEEEERFAREVETVVAPLRAAHEKVIADLLAAAHVKETEAHVEETEPS